MFECTTGQSRRTLVVVGLAATLLALPAAWWIGPWLHAASLPLQLHLTAPTDMPIEVRWGAGASDKAPLVPHAVSSSTTADLWLADLPPRPQYHLSFTFGKPMSGNLRQLLMPSGQMPFRPVYHLEFPGGTKNLKTDGVALDVLADGVELKASAGGRIELQDTIKQCSHSRLQDAAITWVILLMVLLPSTVAVLASLHSVESPTAWFASGREHTSLLWIAVAVASLVQLFMIANSPLLFAECDTTSYLTKAITLAEHCHYDTGGFEYELNRPPGYPILLALGIKLFGYHMTSLTMFQSVLFMASLTSLAFSVRRWVPDLWLALAILLAGLSPAQTWFARILLSESSFASFSLLAMACLFRHISTTGRKATAWFLLYSLAATATAFIRANGVVVFAACIPLYVPGAFQILRTQALTWKMKLKQLARYSRVYAAGAAMSLALVVSWSIRNHDSRGYFCFADMGGITKLAGLVESGLFDPACLMNDGLYTQYIEGRYTTGYWFSAWNLRTSRFLARSENGNRPSGKTLRKLDRDLIRIADDCLDRLPKAAQLGATLRSLYWAILIPDTRNFNRQRMRWEYSAFGNHLQEPKLTEQIEFCSPRFIRDHRQPNSFTSAELWLAKKYFVVYYPLLIAAVLSVVWLSLRGLVALTIPGWVFAANLVLIAVLLNPCGRYIQVMDALLVFQCVLALGTLASSRSRDTVGIL